MKVAVDEAGFRYVRFHDIFNGDMFVYHEKDGKPFYNFQYLDDLFDRMLAMHAKSSAAYKSPIHPPAIPELTRHPFEGSRQLPSPVVQSSPS